MMSGREDHTSWVTDEEQFSQDLLYDILASERRRYTLYFLDRYQTPMALADVADEIARLEHNAETLTEISSEEIKQIYVDLYHCHIPKMEKAGLIEYSQDQDYVELNYDLSELNLEDKI